MTSYGWAYLTVLIVFAVLILNDGLNSITAALREILAVLRKDRP